MPVDGIENPLVTVYVPGELIVQPHSVIEFGHAPAAAAVVSASASIIVNAATIRVLSAFLPTPFIVIIAPPVDANTRSKALNLEVL